MILFFGGKNGGIGQDQNQEQTGKSGSVPGKDTVPVLLVVGFKVF